MRRFPSAESSSRLRGVPTCWQGKINAASNVRFGRQKSEILSQSPVNPHLELRRHSGALDGRGGLHEVGQAQLVSRPEGVAPEAFEPSPVVDERIALSKRSQAEFARHVSTSRFGRIGSTLRQDSACIMKNTTRCRGGDSIPCRKRVTKKGVESVQIRKFQFRHRDMIRRRLRTFSSWCS